MPGAGSSDSGLSLTQCPGSRLNHIIDASDQWSASVQLQDDQHCQCADRIWVWARKLTNYHLDKDSENKAAGI